MKKLFITILLFAFTFSSNAQGKIKFIDSISYNQIENLFGRKQYKNFIELINKEIDKQNIILLVSENNNVYKDDKIKVSSFYKKIEFNQSNIIGKPKIIRIYLPSKCSN